MLHADDYIGLLVFVIDWTLFIIVISSFAAAFKIAGYVYYGFDYSPYYTIIVAAAGASFIGTWIGRKIVDKIPEKQFRVAFRVLITVTALRLLYSGLV